MTADEFARWRPYTASLQEGTVARLTRDQAAVIGAYTGIACGPFGDIQDYAERILGRPIWTHEFASRQLVDELKTAAKDDFVAISAERDQEDR